MEMLGPSHFGGSKAESLKCLFDVQLILSFELG